MQENSGPVDWSKIVTETYELAEAGLKTNYYGAEELTKALIPLLQFSSSAIIVNISSSMGGLEVCESDELIPPIHFGSSIGLPNWILNFCKSQLFILIVFAIRYITI